MNVILDDDGAVEKVKCAVEGTPVDDGRVDEVVAPEVVVELKSHLRRPVECGEVGRDTGSQQHTLRRLDVEHVVGEVGEVRRYVGLVEGDGVKGKAPMKATLTSGSVVWLNRCEGR